ncbi:MAG: 3-oxoacyl-ACP reductase FabG [Thermomicrobium sp.]|nr:3-oxoacyl-ACP reductase FabG [Thermomicrobium sp.]MDW7982373.1 3-oxoacyl-ACP reductase family protein [Thermomicrobium sp.]
METAGAVMRRAIEPESTRTWCVRRARERDFTLVQAFALSVWSDGVRFERQLASEHLGWGADTAVSDGQLATLRMARLWRCCLRQRGSVETEGGQVGRLDGRCALVTGAGMGIGRGIALALADEGAAVALHYAQSREGAEAAAAAIERNGGRAVVVHGDLRSVSECRRIVDDAARALGGLDILVNNAGVTRARPFQEFPADVYDELFELNMRAAFFCSQQAVAYLSQRGGGVILNITSIHGAAGFPRHAAYAATKGALIAFTRSLAIELAPLKIRVNAIGPGLIEVPRYFAIPGYTTELGNRMVPWGRVGKPEDVGRVAVFLASDDAEFITGQIIFVDGGTQARMGLWWEQGDAVQ